MQIDFASRPNSIRPAVFAVTMLTGTVKDWQHWSPLADSTRPNCQDLRFKIYTNDVLEFDQIITSQPVTFVRHLDQSRDTKITFCASGVEFLPTVDHSEIRLGIILQNITVEQYSINHYLTSNQDAQDQDARVQDFPWPSTHLDQFQHPIILAENSCVSFVVGSPVYQWLLDIDQSRFA